VRVAPCGFAYKPSPCVAQAGTAVGHGRGTRPNAGGRRGLRAVPRHAGVGHGGGVGRAFRGRCGAVSEVPRTDASFGSQATAGDRGHRRCLDTAAPLPALCGVRPWPCAMGCDPGAWQRPSEPADGTSRGAGRDRATLRRGSTDTIGSDRRSAGRRRSPPRERRPGAGGGRGRTSTGVGLGTGKGTLAGASARRHAGGGSRRVHGAWGRGVA